MIKDGIDKLFENNRSWVDSVQKIKPEFFQKLSEQQKPNYLWIGCSDSRVPSNQIVGLPPGEVFVHRNIANVVNHGDLNMLSVLQYAVDILEVEHILVCGHYGCGGVKASLSNQNNGLVDNWVRPIKDIYWLEREQFKSLSSDEDRVNHLCELNVRYQVHNVATTSVVQNAWTRGQKLSVHGVIYGLTDGLLKNLDVTIAQASDTSRIYHYD